MLMPRNIRIVDVRRLIVQRANLIRTYGRCKFAVKKENSRRHSSRSAPPTRACFFFLII